MISRALEYIKKGVAPKRHPRWRKVRNEFLKKNKTCACCGGSKKLEVHHIIPVHIDKTLELDKDNLITLCMSGKYGIKCHQFFGHNGRWQDYNIEVINNINYIRLNGFYGSGNNEKFPCQHWLGIADRRGKLDNIS